MAPDDLADPQAELHRTALLRFDAIWSAQAEMRANSLAARRFLAIPGAMWEGSWGEQFANSIRVEIPKVGRAVRRIEGDYRANRIEPDFRPADDDADPETAKTLEGVRRADAADFKARQARDNAFREALGGGFGAWGLAHVMEDEGDKNNDYQRINPGVLIPDADQRVFFDLQATAYDKSDARYAFLLDAWTPDGYRDEFGDEPPASWPHEHWGVGFDWVRPDLIYTCDYYLKEKRREDLLILTRAVTGEEERFWRSELQPEQLAERRKAGWSVKTQRRHRTVVRRYVLSARGVLDDCGVIAGGMIPIVPVYGQREFVDGMERWKGHVQDRMDAQRLYNSNVSRLAELNARSPQDLPIFAPEQMPPSLAGQWARADIDRLSYLLAEPIRDAEGNPVLNGPMAKREAARVPDTLAALIQISNNDLTEEDRDGAGEVRANVSAEAMDMAATRVDDKSELYLDNMAQSVLREGEIYLAMAAGIYVEEGREIPTRTDSGEEGRAELAAVKQVGGAVRTVNDFTKGRYRVNVDVQEATATRRDKTVRQALGMANVALQAQDTDLAAACVITAIMNTDGEGIDDLHSYARRKGLAIGLVQPSEEEQRQAAEQAQQQPPDPTVALAQAQAKELETQAMRNVAEAEKTASEKLLTEAKTVETLAKARAAGADAADTLTDAASNVVQIQPPSGPAIRFGRDVAP